MNGLKSKPILHTELQKLLFILLLRLNLLTNCLYGVQ